MIMYLIGMRGSGKTTIGQLLAARLGLPFVDADAELEAKHGHSIRDIFARDGEAVFRDWEGRLLAELSARPPAVIATGGGIVLREANRATMKSTGKVVWLIADVDALLRRIAADPTTAARRPDLGGGGRAELEQLLGVREPLYRACADLIVATQDRSPEEIVADILPLCTNSCWTTAQ